MFWEPVRGTISISLNATGVCPRAAIFTPSHQPRWLFIRALPQQPERAGPAEPHINAQISALITTQPWIFHPTYLIWLDRVVIVDPKKCYSVCNLFIYVSRSPFSFSTVFAPLHSCYRLSDSIFSLANSIAAVVLSLGRVSGFSASIKDKPRLVLSPVSNMLCWAPGPGRSGFWSLKTLLHYSFIQFHYGLPHSVTVMEHDLYIYPLAS